MPRMTAESVAAEYQLGVEELLDMCDYMEVDTASEAYLFGIVAESMVQPLPADWRECDDEASGQVYYYNEATGVTSWEHPLDQYYKNLLFIERKNDSLRQDQDCDDVDDASPGGGDGGAFPEQHQHQHQQRQQQHQQRQQTHPIANAARKKKRAPTDEELLFEERLKKRDGESTKFQKSIDDRKHPAVTMHHNLLQRIAAAPAVSAKLQGHREFHSAADGSNKYAPAAGGQDTEGSATLVADQNLKRRVDKQTKRMRSQASGLRQELQAMRAEVEGLRHGMFKEMQQSLASFSASTSDGAGPAATAKESEDDAASAVDVAHVQRMELELSTLRNEISMMERAVGSASPTAGGLLSPGAARDSELIQLRNEVQTLKKEKQNAEATQGAGSGQSDGVGGTDAPCVVCAELTQEMAKVKAEAAGSDEALRIERAELADLRVEQAALEAGKAAMQKQNDELKQQLEKLQNLVAEQDSKGEGASDMIANMQQELSAVKAERDESAQNVATLQAQKAEVEAAAADAAQEAAAKLVAAEELATTRMAELATARATAGASGAQVESLTERLSEAETKLAEAEAAIKEQSESMNEREAKAAKECERMFALVKQAHEKVVAKEKEYSAKMEDLKKKNDADIQKRVAEKVKTVQKKLDEESAKRRALFNQIQELKGNIRVYCRVRPCLSDQEKEMGMGIEFAGPHNDLVVANPDRPQLAPKRFEFEQVFTPQQTTQAGVFKEIEPLATSVVDGYNVCIFAYGQTGSGKTHTMEGPKNASEEDLGIYYRSVRQLFKIVEERREVIGITVSVNLLEVYNEEIHDLLIPKKDQTSLEIRRGPQGIFVENLTTVPVESAKQVLEVLAEGNLNRAVTSTSMNEQSSRSHSMLVVNVNTVTHGTDKKSSAALTLVDLAGSERPSKSNVTGQAMKEAQHINKSLSALADVIAARGMKSAHVPYRNSKLTALLQESLGGDSKTLMLVHCRPTGDNISETLCTLNFATRVRAVEMGPAGGGQKKQGGGGGNGGEGGGAPPGGPGSGKQRPAGRPRPQRS